MKESAQIALSLARSTLSSILPSNIDFGQMDIHIHVPSGAIPKDGPSAGVTLLVALVSLLLGQSVPPDLGMTGEITLRGTVLPVGGVKEKILAGHRAGLKQIILPSRNEQDLEEVPQETRKDMKFIFVDRIEEVLSAAIRLAILPQSPVRELQPRQQMG